MQRIMQALCATCLAGSAPLAGAQEAAITLRDVALETWLYGAWHDVRSGSVLNPGNGIARLPEEQLTSETKLNLTFDAPRSEILIRPIVVGRSNRTDFGTDDDVDAYLSQAYVRSALGAKLSATLGRELLTLGPSNFRSPSTPYYFDAGRTDPLREVAGLDLARLTYTSGSYGLTAAYIVDSGRVSTTPDFSDSLLLKLDAQGADWLVSGVASKTTGMSAYFGGFAQKQVHDALLAYGEIGHGSRAGGVATNPMLPAGAGSSEERSTALLGATYTRAGGDTISLEYLYNGHGLSGAERDRYFNRAAAASTDFRSAVSADARGVAQGALASSLIQAPAPLSKHYLYALWQSNPIDGTLYWRLSWALNLEDRSSQLIWYAEKNMSERISLFGLLSANLGDERTEYGALTRGSVIVGVKFFLF